MKKQGIALLITMLFLIAISASIAIGFGQIEDASKSIRKEHFILQCKIINDDIVRILRQSKQLDSIASKQSISGLHDFVLAASFIPISADGLHVTINIKSARSKFDINNLLNQDRSININKVQALKSFLARNGANEAFVNIILDDMGKIKGQTHYNNILTNRYPGLLQGYISSPAQFHLLYRFYINSFEDDSLKNIDFNKLFYFTNKQGNKIDLNFATLQTWEMLLNTNAQRASLMVAKEGSYKNMKDLNLNTQEQKNLNRFNVSFFEPIIYVTIHVSISKQNAYIGFAYNLQTKAESNVRYSF